MKGFKEGLEENEIKAWLHDLHLKEFLLSLYLSKWETNFIELRFLRQANKIYLKISKRTPFVLLILSKFLMHSSIEYIINTVNVEINVLKLIGVGFYVTN